MDKQRKTIRINSKLLSMIVRLVFDRSALIHILIVLIASTVLAVMYQSVGMMTIALASLTCLFVFVRDVNKRLNKDDLNSD